MRTHVWRGIEAGTNEHRRATVSDPAFAPERN